MAKKKKTTKKKTTKKSASSRAGRSGKRTKKAAKPSVRRKRTKQTGGKKTTKKARKTTRKKKTTRRKASSGGRKKTRSASSGRATKKGANKKRTKQAAGKSSRSKGNKKRSSSRRTRTKKDDTVLMDTLLNSTARARMLRLIFREPTVSFPHKEIAQTCGVALPKVRREAKALAEMGIVTNRSSGGKMRVKVNTAFPFVEELKRMATASFPIGRESLVKMLSPAGAVKLIIVAGTLMNDPKGRVDLLVVADRYSEKRLARVVKKVEQAAAAELRWAGMPTKEFKYRWKMFDRFLRDTVSGPHEKLVEKVKIR